jgi:hypothetical protein
LAIKKAVRKEFRFTKEALDDDTGNRGAEMMSIVDEK